MKLICDLCPRACGALRDETHGEGFCRCPALPRLARAALHFWEEPPISGEKGSGTVFFSGCNLGCVFCQNAPISCDLFGETVSVARLAEIFAELEAQGAHNINLVTPTPYIPAILQALSLREPHVPVVFNCGGYESAEALHMLAGKVQVYLCDVKYVREETAVRYAQAPGYFAAAQRAVAEMFAQTGPAEFDEAGLIKKGTVLRHLVLPGRTGESIRFLEWYAAVWKGRGVPLSLMSQYTPNGRTAAFPELCRTLTAREYARVEQAMAALGIEEGWVQERASAAERYIPAFDLTGVEKNKKRT